MYISIHNMNINSEARRRIWREFHHRKLAGMTPEQIEQFRKAKADYDREYREKNKERKRECRKRYAATAKIKGREWRLKNKVPCQRVVKTDEERAESNRKSWKAYAERNRVKRRSYYNDNRERLLQDKKRYHAANRTLIIQKQNAKTKLRKKADPVFKLMCNLRCGVGRILRGLVSRPKSMSLIGCDRETLRLHLETQFTAGMTWENYGRKGWSVDHKRPCSSFTFSDPEQIKQCFHYTNLQPLWHWQNSQKGNRLNYVFKPVLASEIAA